MVVNACPKSEDLGLASVDIANAEVKVELLGVLAARPRTLQSSIRWNARVARPSGLSGVTPPPGGASVAKFRSEPSSMGQPRRPE
jgi:hypothetical protein